MKQRRLLIGVALGGVLVSFGDSLWAQDPPIEPDDGWTVDRVATLVHHAQTRVMGRDPFMATWVIERATTPFSRKSPTSPDELDALVKAVAFDPVASLEVWWSSGRYRVALAVDGRRELEQYWDGEQAAVRRRTGTIDMGAMHSAPDTRGFAYLLNELEGVVRLQFPSLAEMIRRSEPMSHEQTDGRLTWRFKGSTQSDGYWEVELDVAHQRLLRFTQHFTDSKNPEGLPRLRVDRIITDWEPPDQGGRAIEGFVIVGGSSRDGITPPDGKWHGRVERYRRVKIEPLTPLDEMFRPALDKGTPVSDERAGLQFVVGEGTFVVDGVIYRTREPILSHPGERMTELLASAERVVEVQPIAAPATPGPLRSWLNPLAYGIVAAAAVLGVIWLFRYIGARRAEGAV